jgi:hypothetical protein
MTSPTWSRVPPATIVKASGSVPEWPKGADCKSAGDAYGGSNPSRPTMAVTSGFVRSGPLVTVLAPGDCKHFANGGFRLAPQSV